MLLGLVARRPRWGLSLRGWLVLAIALAVGALGVARAAYPFLALTTRTPAADVLIVEGWVHDYVIHAAAGEFQQGYRVAIATGGPVAGLRLYLNDYSTAAHLGAQRLRREGLPAASVHAAPARAIDRDRTYQAALALRDWLATHGHVVRRLNIVTEDVHARRTRLLFQTALGPEVSVGVIAIPNPSYDAAHWWRYSEGVRAVIGEAISYLYAKFLFFPPATAPAGAADTTAS